MSSKKIIYDYGDLPRNNRNNIAWENSIGKCIHFEYQGFKGDINILSFRKDRTYKYVTIEYNNRIKEMPCKVLYSKGTDNLIINTYLTNSKNIGDIINYKDRSFVISGVGIRKDKKHNTELPFYRVICLKCKQESVIDSNRLSNIPCKVCDNLEVAYGVNDITTTDPWMIPYFDSIEDAAKYVSGTRKKIVPKCPRCGMKHDKEISICQLNYQKGFRCKYCSDSIPYTEKMINNILQQLGVDYYFQPKSDQIEFDTDGRIYDFYIPSLACIIETHGMQHYKDSYFGGVLQEAKKTQENDLFKKQLATKNGIKHYIVIDCRYSNFNWIKRSVLNSSMPTIFNFNEQSIDWIECEKSISSSIVVDICNDYHNNFLTTKELSKKYNKCISTIKKYLKAGTNIGICKFSADINANKTPIEILKNDKHFLYAKNIQEASEKLEKIYGDNTFSRYALTYHQKNKKPYKDHYVKYVEDIPTKWEILYGKYDNETPGGDMI